MAEFDTDPINYGHRKCAIHKLVVLIKMASEGPDPKKEDFILSVGLRALTTLGVTQEEIATATIDLVLSSMMDREKARSPLVGDVNDDSAVSSVDGEDSERKSGTNTKA